MTNALGASVSILNYGGIIQAIRVPDAQGHLADVALGYADMKGLCGKSRLSGRVDRPCGQPHRRGALCAEWKDYQLAAMKTA